MIVALLTEGGRDVAAGCEEESVPSRIEQRAGAAAELARGRRALAPAGVGVGGDATTLVVALAAWPEPYVTAPVAQARAVGHLAARLAARRPLRFPAVMKPVLIVENDQLLAGAGWIARVLDRRGLPYRQVDATAGGLDGIDAAGLSGLITLGGRAHAWQEDAEPFLAPSGC